MHNGKNTYPGKIFFVERLKRVVKKVPQEAKSVPQWLNVKFQYVVVIACEIWKPCFVQGQRPGSYQPRA
jgi:hypothetical protein